MVIQRRTMMAEVLTALSSLLFLSIGVHHASHVVVRTQGDSLTFKHKSKTFCVISKLTPRGEPPQPWNSPKLSSRNATTTEDVGRSQIGDAAEGFLFDTVVVIVSLSKSDSGRYKKTCWENSSNPAHEEFSLTVCSARHPDLRLAVASRSPLELRCSGAGGNSTVLWFKRRPHSDEETCWIHGAVIAVAEDFGGERHLVAVNGSALRVHSFSRGDAYVCLLLDGRSEDCASTQTLTLDVTAERVYRTEGETALLPCFDEANRSALWETPDGIRRMLAGNGGGSVQKGNYSLLISSLKPDHTGEYFCSTTSSASYVQHYLLLVCPDSPPLREVFFEGDKATLRCHSGNVSAGDGVAWFRRTSRHHGNDGVIWDSSFERLPADLDGRALVVAAHPSGPSLVLWNLSRPDGGEYWCHAVAHRGAKCSCTSTSRVVLTYRERAEPFYFFATWASLMACGLVVMICLVAAVFQKHKCGRTFHTESDTNTVL